MRVHIAIILLAFGACDVERPSVSDQTFKQPKFTHATLTTATCVECHESARPEPDDEGNKHGNGEDCGGCHEPSDTKAGWMPPKSFSHQPPPKSCVGCHSNDRPKPPHPKSGDCVSCHKYPNWEPQTSGGETLAFSHEPPPKSCNGCHADDRPAPPHVKEGDCVTCHKFPNWK